MNSVIGLKVTGDFHLVLLVEDEVETVVDGLGI